MPDPAGFDAEKARLVAALGGDFRTGGTAWGLEFVVRPGRLQILIDAHPFPIPAAQVEALAALGYAADPPEGGRQRFRHADRPVELLALDHPTGEFARRVVVRDFLAAHPDEPIPEDDDPAPDLVRRARAWRVERTGWAPLLALAADLEGFPAPWAVASGWALDLAVGRPLRPHEDLDVTVPRADHAALRPWLAARGWDLYRVERGEYRPWREGETVEAPHHQVHAWKDGVLLDLLLSEMDGGPTEERLWRFRRRPEITLPLRRAFRTGALGLPALAPEVVLLFKSSSAGGDPRGKDQEDFETVLPVLDPEARAWLRDALAAYLPEHPWLARL